MDINLLDSIQILVQVSLGRIYALLSQNGLCGDKVICCEMLNVEFTGVIIDLSVES